VLALIALLLCNLFVLCSFVAHEIIHVCCCLSSSASSNVESNTHNATYPPDPTIAPQPHSLLLLIWFEHFNPQYMNLPIPHKVIGSVVCPWPSSSLHINV